MPPTEVRYGNLDLTKRSNVDGVDLAGAEFRVYPTLTGAERKDDEEYDPTSNTNGYLTTAENSSGLWVTDENGKVTLGGFRYSYYADGAALVSPADDAKIQTYWLVEVKALDGHQLLGEPVEFVIGGTDGDTHDATALEVVNYKDGGFELPLTGGTGTWFIIAAGAALLFVVLLVGARRRKAEANA